MRRVYNLCPKSKSKIWQDLRVYLYVSTLQYSIRQISYQYIIHVEGFI